MAKPIFIVEIPEEDVQPAKFGEENAFSKLAESLQETFKDEYYVLVVTTKTKADVDFRVFYEKDFNDVKFEELKEVVRQSISATIQTVSPALKKLAEHDKKK
jgi:predicted DNA-binding protein YlxM (UPF0122 family)